MDKNTLQILATSREEQFEIHFVILRRKIREKGRKSRKKGKKRKKKKEEEKRKGKEKKGEILIFKILLSV